MANTDGPGAQGGTRADAPTNGTPLSNEWIVTTALKKVPFVAYAVGVAALAILMGVTIKAIGVGLKEAMVAVVVMLLLMVILRAVALKSPHTPQALVLAWLMVVMIVVGLPTGLWIAFPQVPYTFGATDCLAGMHKDCQCSATVGKLSCQGDGTWGLCDCPAAPTGTTAPVTSVGAAQPEPSGAPSGSASGSASARPKESVKDSPKELPTCTTAQLNLQQLWGDTQALTGSDSVALVVTVKEGTVTVQGDPKQLKPKVDALKQQKLGTLSCKAPFTLAWP